MINKKIIKTYIPMTETAYYILLSLNEQRHGYGIIKFVDQLTNGRICLGSGTVYTSLKKMTNDGLISITDDKDRKTVYQLTDLGKELMQIEIDRVKKVYFDTLTLEECFR